MNHWQAKVTVILATILFTAFAVSGLFLGDVKRLSEKLAAADSITTTSITAATTTSSVVDTTTIATTSTTVSFAMTRATSTTTTSIDWNVDSCGRGTNYPVGQYTGPVPQATPDDPMPDPRLCPQEYKEWVRRQEPNDTAVSFCSIDGDGIFDWIWDDPEVKVYWDEGIGHYWACQGTDPFKWVKMYGEPPYNTHTGRKS